MVACPHHFYGSSGLETACQWKDYAAKGCECSWHRSVTLYAD